MSRLIKFRVWDEKEKDFILPNSIYLRLDGEAIASEQYSPILGTERIIGGEIDENLVFEQFTGLKDKNGKEIYEGDIIKAKIDGFWQTGAHTVSAGKATWNLEVIYSDIRYMDVFHILGSKNQPNRIYYLFDKSISDIEVIGNIHENPELLDKDNRV